VNALDIAIIGLVAVLAMIGYAQGFIIGFASLFGVLLGGVVGVRVAHLLLERSASAQSASEWAPLLGLAVGLAITIIGAMAMQDLGAEMRARVQVTEDHVALDHALGAVLLALVGLVLTWFAAASAIGMPQLRDMRSEIVESRLVSGLNGVLPDAGPLLGALSAYDPFPKFDGGAIDAAPPDESLPDLKPVRVAALSVVRVVGDACGYRVTGSGWVPAPGYVMTNAHVVAGEDNSYVQTRGGNNKMHATVVWFDATNDIAILRVPNLGLPSLKYVDKPVHGTGGVIIGYPENHGLQTNAARIDAQKLVRAKDIYDHGPVEREIVAYRGVVRHGNSGGPVVGADGKVLATVFATTIDHKIRGGYGVPNKLMAEALGRAKQVPADRAARTGPCIA
jgi:uncharacterized membrane protein required for colicin V production